MASRANDTAALQVACRPARHAGPGTGVQLASVWVEAVGTDRVDSSWVAAGYAADVPVAAWQVGVVIVLHTGRRNSRCTHAMRCHARFRTQCNTCRQKACALNVRWMLAAGAAPVAPSIPCALTPSAAAHTAHAWLLSALHNQVSIKHNLLLLLKR